MPRLLKFSLLFAAPLWLAACTIERTPHLYPRNEVAASGGVVSGQFVGHGNLHGTAKFNMPDGEVLNGEYSIVADGEMHSGNGFASVYGASGPSSLTGSSFGYSMSGRGNGEASLFGNRGTQLECEFANNNMTGHGSGECRSSKGGLYKMQY